MNVRPSPGMRFHSWTVVSWTASATAPAAYVVRCDCGATSTVLARDLISGKSKRCRACGNRTPAQRGVVKHGNLRGNVATPTYRSWKSMVERCNKPSNASYPNYGGAGVRICDRWLGDHGFENFLADLGERPPGTTLDRFPNYSGDYEPGNVRWATIAQQNRNKGDTRLVTIGDRTQCLKDWATEFGLRYDMVHARIRRGWTVERALGIARTA